MRDCLLTAALYVCDHWVEFVVDYCVPAAALALMLNSLGLYR